MVKNGRKFSFVVKKSVPVNNHGHVGTVASDFMALLTEIKMNDTPIPAIKHRKISSYLTTIGKLLSGWFKVVLLLRVYDPFVTLLHFVSTFQQDSLRDNSLGLFVQSIVSLTTSLRLQLVKYYVCRPHMQIYHYFLLEKCETDSKIFQTFSK